MLLGGAVAGYSQGSISFAGFVTGFKQQIFNVQASAPANGTLVSVTYNGATVQEYQGASTGSLESPAGTVAYTSPLSGAGYDAQLFASTSPTASSYSQLAPVVGSTSTGILNFYTAPAAAGFIQNADTDPIPGTSSSAGQVVSIAIAAWQNSGVDGAAASLATAIADGYAWGFSPITTLSTTVTPASPASMSGAANTSLSFSLGSVPEPSTIALGVIGASTLLFRRRK